MVNEDTAGARPDSGLDLRELDESTASAAVLAAFDEIRDVLRVPFVDQLWRVMAFDPAWLESSWRFVGPSLGITAAERAADELRRVAVIPLAIALPSHKAFRGDMSRAEVAAEDRARISNYTAAAHYVLPKLLLAAATLTGPSRSATATSGGIDTPRAERLPRGIAEGAPRVEPMDPGARFGEATALFAEIRRRHGYDAIGDYYRAIARAGDFLRISLNALRPVIGDPEHSARALAVSTAARRLAGALPAPTSPVPEQAHRDSTRARVLEFYLDRLLPEMLVEITVVKGLMDGPHTAAYSRFSLTDTLPADPDFHDSAV
ncbi:MAG: hypothetical protein ACYDCQ_09460 [Dehalococcoidia bacterium]